MTIPYIQYNEPAIAQNSPTGVTDVINRPLRFILTASGLNPDATFPGFIPNQANISVNNLSLTGSLNVAGSSTLTGNVIAGAQLTVTGNIVSTAGKVALGAAPGTTNAINIDSSSYNAAAGGIHFINGAESASITLSTTQLVLQTLDATSTLVLGTNTVQAWQVNNNAAGTAEFKALQAVSRFIGGATSLSLRNNANTRDNLLIADAGSSYIFNNGTQTGSINLGAASGELTPAGIFVSPNNNAQGVYLATSNSGTSSKAGIMYWDGSQYRSAVEVTNTAGFGTLTLMKSGGTISLGGTLQFGANQTADENVAFSAATGFNVGIDFQTNSSDRWRIRKNAIAEGGGNAGSNLTFDAFSDAAAFIDSPLQLTRVAAGQVTLGGTGSKRTTVLGYSGGDISLTDTSGYIAIPSMNGVPTGVPASPASAAGLTPVVYNRLNKSFAVYDSVLAVWQFAPISTTSLQSVAGTGSITPDFSTCDTLVITNTGGGGGTVTINAPTNAQTGRFYKIVIRNASSGASTWSFNVAFSLQATAPAPGVGTQFTLEFRYDGTKFFETFRTASAVSN